MAANGTSEHTGLEGFASRLQNVFGASAPSDPSRNGQVERALRLVRLVLALAGLCALGYGWLQHGLGGGLTALLGAASAFAVGSVLGFLFGLPRWTDVSEAAKAVQDASKPDQKPLASGRDPYTVRPNTNLERIMDWLTALIVGLTLVHWQDLVKQGTQVSVDFTAAIAGAEVVRNGSAGAAILLSFAVGGFIVVYLWSQRYMGLEMARADWESRRVRELEEKLTDSKKRQNELVEDNAGQLLKNIQQKPADSGKTENEFLKGTAGPLAGAVITGIQGAAPDQDREAQKTREAAFRRAGSVVEEYEVSQFGSLAKRLRLPDQVVRDIRRRYRTNTDYFDEPMRGFGPTRTAGFSLDAEVDAFGKHSFMVHLRLSAELAPPEETQVVFFLHHTLPDCIRVATMVHDEAAIEVPCIGSFIAGALVVGSGAQLSIDLAELPGVPREFRDG